MRSCERRKHRISATFSLRGAPGPRAADLRHYRRSRERARLGVLGWASRSLPPLCAALVFAAPVSASEPGYVAGWGEVLAAHTRGVETTVGTTVDYAALRGPAAGAWRTVVRSLAEAPEPPGRDQKLALWINAYNILAIDMVVRNGPVESIRDIGNFIVPVWKREAGTVAGRGVSLDRIEHEILRAMGEPRIHAAIVCASTSCPSLRRSPFTAAELDAQLDDALRRWLASPEKGLRIDRAANRVTVSKIFDWFEEDFGVLGGVRKVLAKYAPERDRAWLAGHVRGASLDHFDYDWTLNRVQRQKVQ